MYVERRKMITEKVNIIIYRICLIVNIYALIVLYQETLDDLISFGQFRNADVESLLNYICMK